MDKQPVIRVIWHGHKTITDIPRLLNKTEQLEITLPDSYNHALFRALNPNAPDSALEEINTKGGPEVLYDITTVRGLEEFAALIDTLRIAHASVRVVSPPTLIIQSPPAMTLN